MKKAFVVLALAVLALGLTSCGSMRTPDGKNNKKNYYYTFFGISLESAVYGDGLIVNGNNNN